MARPDRIRFIELLNRFGAEDDDTVLAAARELHRSVKEAGLEWDGLLQADGGSVAAESEAPASAQTPIDHSGEMKIIDRLLARQDLSDIMRSDLADFKRGIREGTFDRMDADYVRALAKRLGA